MAKLKPHIRYHLLSYLFETARVHYLYESDPSNRELKSELIEVSMRTVGRSERIYNELMGLHKEGVRLSIEPLAFPIVGGFQEAIDALEADVNVLITRDWSSVPISTKTNRGRMSQHQKEDIQVAFEFFQKVRVLFTLVHNLSINPIPVIDYSHY